jgi:hypothetical protein
MKCKYCNTPHKNKSEESDYQEISDTCQRCGHIVSLIASLETSINNIVPLGKSRPRRRLTIIFFKIEKI